MYRDLIISNTDTCHTLLRVKWSLKNWKVQTYCWENKGHISCYLLSKTQHTLQNIHRQKILILELSKYTHFSYIFNNVEINLIS